MFDQLLCYYRKANQTFSIQNKDTREIWKPKEYYIIVPRFAKIISMQGLFLLCRYLLPENEAG
jgi:hypothetical protein